jgi:hypothetical protein
MSKLGFISRLAMLCSLAVLASAVSIASASAAEPFKSPALKVCQSAPAGYTGLYTSGTCETNSATGTFAWSTAASATTTAFCLLSATANQLYTEGLCQTDSSGKTGKLLAETFSKTPPKLVATIDASTLKGKVAGAEAEIVCTGGKATDTAETGSLSSGPILYTGCTSKKPSGCEISSASLKKPGEIKTEGLMATLSSATLINFTPETGKKFVELEFTGSSCTITSGTTAEVEGKQMCTFLSNVEASATDHNFLCKTTESGLELGKKTATYEGLNLLGVEGGLNFAIK